MRGVIGCLLTILRTQTEEQGLKYSDQLRILDEKLTREGTGAALLWLPSGWSESSPEATCLFDELQRAGMTLEMASGVFVAHPSD